MYTVKIAPNWSLPAAVLPVGELTSRLIFNIIMGKEKRRDCINAIGLQIRCLCIDKGLFDAVLYVSNGNKEIGIPVKMLSY